jgi:hypothetical protein
MVPWFEFYLPRNVMREPAALVLLEMVLWLGVLLVAGLAIAVTYERGRDVVQAAVAGSAPAPKPSPPPLAITLDPPIPHHKSYRKRPKRRWDFLSLPSLIPGCYCYRMR